MSALGKNNTSLNTTNTNLDNLTKRVDSIEIALLGLISRTVSMDSLLLANNASISMINTQIATLNQEYQLLLQELNALIALLNSGSPAVTLTSGLVAYYPFSGNSTDSSGYGNHGTVFGATLTSDRFGNMNSAYLFNGTSDYIGTGFSGILGGNSRSISCWIKTNQIYTLTPAQGLPMEPMDIICYGTASGGAVYEMTLNGACEGPSLDIDRGYITFASKVSDDIWHNLVLVFDGSLGGSINLVKYYVDGNNVTNVCGTYPNTINTVLGSPLRIGAYKDFLQGTTKRNFKGALDDIRIYNRVLSPSEVTYLAQH